MAAKLQIVLDEDAMRFVLAAPATRRRRIMAQLEFLRNHSSDPADFREKDLSGRWLSVRALSPFLITYWLDGAVDELRIVDIQHVR
ncbi:MAG: hypothetical protein IPK32_26030 [Verrucomicrobiaceae bacterium]|nr:hypothetical protein [Verrucomicrobiaceae bacterium]